MADKYDLMSEEEFKNMTDKEFEEYLQFEKDDYPMHYQRIKDIKVETILTPEEVIKVAKEYHKKSKSDGIVNEDIENRLFYDEAYTFEINKEDRSKDIIKPAWRVQVDLPPNPFLMEDFTFIVSDQDKKVMDMLDPNGHPVSHGSPLTDEDIDYIMSEEYQEGDENRDDEMRESKKNEN